MDTTEKDIRNLFANSGELDRDEVALLLLQLLERIQNLERAPQRTEQEQQIETLKRCLFQMQEAAKDLVEQAKSLPPPQRKPLTDEEIAVAWSVAEGEHNASAVVKRRITRAIEAARGIKGDA